MSRALSMALFFALVVPVLADDWPQWLGPRRDASTTEKVSAWKGELKALWRVKVGDGHGSPVMVGDKVFLHFALPNKEIERIQCFDVATGDSVWISDYERPVYKGLFGRGPRATPCVADGQVYAFGATGILSCLNAKTGNTVWRVDTKKEFQPPELKFGVSCSPMVVGDKVLVMVGARDASVVAFQCSDGKVAWKSGSSKGTYASPITVGDPKDPVAVFLSYDGAVGIRVADGAQLWQFPFVDSLAESSTTPVRIGDGILISSITKGTALVGISKSGDKWTAKERWFEKDVTCYFSTPVVLGKEIYLVKGSFLNKSASLHCVDAGTGKELWSRGKVGTYHASLMRTGDDKLLMLEETGNLVLIDPDPKMYRELCRAKICAKTWAHPALANGRLTIRDDNKELSCIELGK